MDTLQMHIAKKIGEATACFSILLSTTTFKKHLVLLHLLPMLVCKLSAVLALKVIEFLVALLLLSAPKLGCQGVAAPAAAALNMFVVVREGLKVAPKVGLPWNATVLTCCLAGSAPTLVETKKTLGLCKTMAVALWT
jgi:hypothetical protein